MASSLALWCCRQGADLIPCRPGFKAGWGDCSLPLLHTHTHTHRQTHISTLTVQLSDWYLKSCSLSGKGKDCGLAKAARRNHSYARCAFRSLGTQRASCVCVCSLRV